MRSRFALTSLVALSLAACSSTPADAPPLDAPPVVGDRDAGPAARDAGATPSPTNDGGSPSSPDASVPLPTTCPPSWTPTAECGGASGSAAPPDLGPNVVVFDPSMDMGQIQSRLDSIYGEQDAAQFDDRRYALLFKPGKYDVDVKVGFYTQVLGLGHGPDDVAITGAVRAKADWLGNQNATCNFWRGAENFAVVPKQDGDVDVWAVSQGTALRRVHVEGTIALDDGGWSSGGFIADAKVDGTTRSGTQQQFLTRNVDLGTWEGSNWNMVFVGDRAAPASSWPDPPFTTTAKTPRVREKPFLFVDAAGQYFVMVPAMKTDSQGPSWATGAPPGGAIAIDRFYVAKPSDTAATLNAALAAGKHLLVTPGIYRLDASLAITRPGTIVLGIGYPTLIPTNGNALLDVADVDAVTVAGVLLEAGAKRSAVLMQVGPPGSSAAHAQNPTALFDVHCRVGGARAGTTDRCLEIASHDVIVDDTWLWRADHGAGASWTGNPSKNGLVVDGANVTVYGLFSEHFQEYQTLWNGENGAVFLYQSEMPYDPPSQGDWMAPNGTNGYPSYKVADGVKTHAAEGLGVYSVFQNDVRAENAIEAPAGTNIALHHMVTVSLAAGAIDHIYDGTGGTVSQGGAMVAKSSD